MKRADNVDVFTIQIQVMSGDLSDSAVKLDYFVHHDGKWVIDTDLAGEVEAMTISGHGWKGFKGEASTRCYHEAGGYAGLCDIFLAVISNGNHLSQIVGGAQTEQEFAEVLKSFRFLKHS